MKGLVLRCGTDLATPSHGILPIAKHSLSTITGYAFPHRGLHIMNSDLIPALLYKLNENQLALEAAIMELTLWIELQGSSEVGGNVRGALDVITQNEEFINVSLKTLMPPE